MNSQDKHDATRIPGADAPSIPVVCAVIDSETFPTLLLSAEGRVLHVNPASGAAVVERWAHVAKGSGWRAAVDEATGGGCAELRTETGQTAQLYQLALPNAPLLYLLRPVEGAGHEGELAKRADFLVRLAHDLRSPLQALMLASEGVLSAGEASPTPDAVTEFQMIVQAALVQINGLLDMSTVGGRSEVVDRNQVFDIVEVMRDLATMLGPLCQLQRNKLVVDLPEHPVWLTGALQPIRVIAQNLVSNAARFTREGTIVLSLNVRSDVGFANVAIEVRDTGSGISPELSSWLNDPSCPLPDEQASGSEGGYGLGLRIVAQAGARLGGQFEVSGGPAGSVFRFEFRLALAAAMAEDRRGGRADLSGLRLLVVEDNPVNLAVLMRSAASAGARVEGIADGREALERLSAEPARQDIVLMDVNLPGISGIDIMRELSVRGGAGALPRVIGLTAHDDPDMLARCRMSGMAEVLIKPISPSDLRASLQSHWRGDVVDPAFMEADPVQEEPGPAVGEKGREFAVLLNQQVVELVEELGRHQAVEFMQRALNEARGVLAAARSGIESPVLRPLIHSAIGSAGLTGLAGVEYALRQLQARVRDGGNGDLNVVSALSDTLDGTQAALQGLASSGIGAMS